MKKDTNGNDLLVKQFKEVLEGNWYKVPMTTKELTTYTAKEAASEFDIDYIIDFCMNAYYKLQ
ncbi:hypothetical protein HMPREF1982_02483 [Clostridiales bacterium oral taxon 876 str. F0540]|nr:hypothetical protein HMPREF1982_02483 [Clostridiales bacterium oral taxon 876 str. F0540]